MTNILFYGGASLLSNIWSRYWKDNFNIFIGLNKRWIEIEGVKSLQLKSNINDLDEIITKHKIDIVINCVGLTNVEECEKNSDLAFYLNGYLPGEIAKITSNTSAKLIHISTDHLFDGKSKENQEDDLVKPLNTYAKSKLLGENEVFKNDSSALIIRTNFFGKGPLYKPSFSDKIISSLINKKQIYLFNNVYYTPIHVNELADGVLKLIEYNREGIFNISSNERMTKYDFGLLIAKTMNENKDLIIPISIEEKTDLILRPNDMSLNNSKFLDSTKMTIKSINDQVLELIKISQIDVNTLQ